MSNEGSTSRQMTTKNIEKNTPSKLMTLSRSFIQNIRPHANYALAVVRYFYETLDLVDVHRVTLVIMTL